MILWNYYHVGRRETEQRETKVVKLLQMTTRLPEIMFKKSKTLKHQGGLKIIWLNASGTIIFESDYHKKLIKFIIYLISLSSISFFKHWIKNISLHRWYNSHKEYRPKSLILIHGSEQEKRCLPIFQIAKIWISLHRLIRILAVCQINSLASLESRFEQERFSSNFTDVPDFQTLSCFGMP